MTSQNFISCIIRLTLFSALLAFTGCATDKNTNTDPQPITGKVEATGQPLAEPDEKIKEVIDATPQKLFQENLDTALEFCQASNDYWEQGDLENAIDALDQAYSLILKINSNEAPPEIMQEKEDLRFTISKRIAEVYASRFTVANGNHKEIPLDMNRHVEKALKLFKGRKAVLPRCLLPFREVPSCHCKGP